jgi:16S rRNA processing protein RimM
LTSRRQAANARRAQHNKTETGSAPISEPEFVLVGILRRPHGLRGEAQVTIETDFPERLQPGVKLYLGDQHAPVTIRSQRPIDDGLLLAFEEFPDRNAIEHLRNAPLFTHVNDSPALPPGRYYRHQLIGLRVVDEEQGELGTLAQILETSANDVYLVRSERFGEVLLPAIDEVVLAVDLEHKQVRVKLLPGLLPEEKG